MSHSRRSSTSSSSSQDSHSSRRSASTNLTTPHTSPYKSTKGSPSHSQDHSSDEDCSDEEHLTTSSRSSSAGDSPRLQRAFQATHGERTTVDSPAASVKSLPKSWFGQDEELSEKLKSVDLDTEDKRLKELEKEEPLLKESPDRFVLFPIKYPEVRRLEVSHTMSRF